MLQGEKNICLKLEKKFFDVMFINIGYLFKNILIAKQSRQLEVVLLLKLINKFEDESGKSYSQNVFFSFQIDIVTDHIIYEHVLSVELCEVIKI